MAKNKDINASLDTYRCLVKNRNANIEKAEKDIQENADKRAKFVNEYYKAIDGRKDRERRHGQLMEAARNNALSTAIKAIYITALEAETLTDNGLLLAESMVDNWIKESGGASVILRKNQNNTYFLNRLASIVEDSAEDDVKEVDKVEKDNGEEEEPKKEEETKEDPKEAEEEDKKPEEKPEGEEEKDIDAELDSDDEEEPKEDSLGSLDFEDDEDMDGDVDETDDAEDIVDDLEEVPDKDSTIDGGEENNGKIFDELEKEEDVKKAIELIRQRVADAEETFIKRNAEDKKQIEELISKVSDNVKTVNDMEEENPEEEPSTEEKIAAEHVRMTKQKINSITENRPQSVFERMTRTLASNIIKDQAIREQYLNESGTVSMAYVVETAKVMYGFLETLNTLQLEKVDSKYIAKVLKEMK